MFYYLIPSINELRNVKDICQKGLKGIVPLLDYGKIEKKSTSVNLGIKLDSYFIVYEFLE